MEPVKIEDIAQYRFLSDLKLSPSGKYGAFIVRQSEKKLDGYTTDLYLYSEKKCKKLTSKEKIGSFLFEDDETIIYQSFKNAKKNQEKGPHSEFFRLNVNGGKPEFAFSLPLGGSLKKLDDGRYLVSGKTDLRCPELYKLEGDERKKALGQLKEEADYMVIDEHPWWFNGVGYINKTRSSYFIYDPESKSIERIHDAELSVGPHAILGDFLYFAGAYQKVIAPMEDAIYKYNLKSKELTEVFPADKYSVHGLYALEGKIVVSGTCKGKYGLNENARFFYLNEGAKTLDEFAAPDMGFSGTLTDVCWGHGGGFKSDGKALYFTVQDRYNTPIKKMHPDGTIEDVAVGEGAYFDFDIKNGKILTLGLFGNRLGEVYEVVEKKPKRASNLNGKFLKGRYVAKPKKISFKSEGWDLDGWVLLPKDYDPSKKYPAVLDIHGGPKCAYGTVFFHEMQVWASLGYFVFFCNPFGGDGRGNEFADLRGKYGGIDFKNIMDFTDVVLKKYPQIDPSKVCETGGSYGGFMTNWIATHTDRFCALATQRSISDWMLMEANSDIGIHFDADQCGGGDVISEEGRAQLMKHSPIKDAKNLKTPLLVIHSEQDYRCPIENGYLMYTACVQKGVETRMVVFKGENHDLSRGGMPKHRIRRLNEITDWFNKHTK